MMNLISRYLLVMALMFASNAWATTITYSTVDLGSDRWRYDYTLENDSLSTAIEEFTIYFELGRYENLDVITPEPAGWSGTVVQPGSFTGQLRDYRRLLPAT